jgi:hypothetical protein
MHRHRRTRRSTRGRSRLGVFSAGGAAPPPSPEMLVNPMPSEEPSQHDMMRGRGPPNAREVSGLLAASHVEVQTMSTVEVVCAKGQRRVALCSAAEEAALSPTRIWHAGGKQRG